MDFHLVNETQELNFYIHFIFLCI